MKIDSYQLLTIEHQVGLTLLRSIANIDAVQQSIASKKQQLSTLNYSVASWRWK
ncbi:MAG: hypothetical protein HC849_33310 [Oscillatoriales cyanobacterium RU_3_3]|nr:hypothetical protein [Microcoleus sp. SU_5_6]NJM63917.1 hypothetical protein [Oscillatoriales cyanobacterium RU_3_3]NJR25079.1 hypothetical protein [Richelia sp. CSU_2_1]